MLLPVPCKSFSPVVCEIAAAPAADPAANIGRRRLLCHPRRRAEPARDFPGAPVRPLRVFPSGPGFVAAPNPWWYNRLEYFFSSTGGSADAVFSFSDRSFPDLHSGLRGRGAGAGQGEGV